MKSPLDPENRPKRKLFDVIKLDPILLLQISILSALGLLILYSAGGKEIIYVKKQAIHYALGFGVMFAIAQIRMEYIKIAGLIAFVVCILLLIAVLSFGAIHKGAQRWLDLGFMQFQPSELMKLALPMAVAFYLSKTIMPVKPLKFLIATIIVLVPVALILLQPDLGTAILIGCSGALVIFFAGLTWKIIFGLLAGIGAFLPVLWQFIMKEYQKQRVMTLFNPELDPLGSGYHIIQSKIAIGSGGIFGKGWLSGTQSQLEFLPEKHTDFIFAVLAEEFGFFGVLLFFFLFFLLVARMLWLAHITQDIYCKLLAGSLGMISFLYFFINVGMVSGIIPVVGLPLPFISYGGTTLLALFIGFGLMMAIYNKTRQEFIKMNSQNN